MKTTTSTLTAALVAVSFLTLPSLAQAAIFDFGQPAATQQAERVQLAQAQDTSQLLVRIQQLEEQLRSVNGQVGGLTFQLTQMQELINRTTEESQVRFQALEGGSATPVQPAAAAPASTDSVPSTEIPAQGVQPLPGEVEFDPTFDDGSTSGDPLVGTGAEGGVDLATGQPLDLSYPASAANSGDPDADAQFTAGTEAMSRGDYSFAEDQFSQFLDLYPDNPQATDAAEYLGDALLQRQAYSEAAEVLLTAFQDAPDSPKAPNLLLKLGQSLSGAGEQETACRTLAEVDRRYTTLTPDFAARLASAKANAQCPPA